MFRASPCGFVLSNVQEYQGQHNSSDDQHLNYSKKTSLAMFAFVFCFASVSFGQRSDHTRYVNTFIGTFPLTDSVVLGYRLPDGWRSWAGLTFPGSSLPNAMVQLSPITEYHSGAGYEYEDNVIYGLHTPTKGIGIFVISRCYPYPRQITIHPNSVRTSAISRRKHRQHIMKYISMTTK